MIAADAPTAGSPLDVVSLPRLMERTVGRPEIAIGLIDGPVAAGHADLVAASLRSLPSPLAGPSGRPSGARAHGTYVAGILSARRGSAAPAICPRCTLLVRPIFLEPSPGTAEAPSASPGELAAAIVDCIQAGAPRLTCQRKVIATWQESCSEPLPPIFSTTTAPTARFQRSESELVIIVTPSYRGTIAGARGGGVRPQQGLVARPPIDLPPVSINCDFGHRWCEWGCYSNYLNCVRSGTRERTCAHHYFVCSDACDVAWERCRGLYRDPDYDPFADHFAGLG